MTTSTADRAAIEQPLDAAKAEAFAGQMIQVLNHAALGVMTSIGHQVGLFDALATLPPSTSAEVARAAGLVERYVREWLNAMVTGRVVEYDPATGRYHLPPEHAASLTRAAGKNLAAVVQIVPMLSTVEQDVVRSFRNGGGVPYSEFTRFHAWMAENSGATFDAALLDQVLPLVPGLRERLETGIDVADVGCGSGHAVNILARAFPNSRFVGYDFSEPAIAVARQEAADWGLTNARFELRDVTHLDDVAAFDFITSFDAIHDQAHPRAVLAGIQRALRPGGVYLMVELRASSNVEENHDLPWATYLYTVSTLHCMTVSLSLDGEGLGTMWGEQLAQELLSEAGFGHAEVAQVEGDLFNSYFIVRK